MSDQVVTQYSREAPYMEAAREQNIQDALNAVKSRSGATMPSVPNAAESPLSQISRDLAGAGIGAYAPYLQGAATTFGMAGGVLGQGSGIAQMGLGSTGYFPYAHMALGAIPDSISLADQRLMGAMGAGSSWFQGAGNMYDPAMAEPFYDPYLERVIETQQREIGRLGEQQQIGASAQAVGAGAFGGSREAVHKAEIDRNTMDQQARTGSQLRSAGHQWAQTQAQQAFEDAMRRRQQAGTVLGGLGMQGAQQTLAQGDLLRQMGLSTGALAGQESDIWRSTGLGIGALGSELGQIGTREAQLGQLQSQLLGSDVQRMATLAELQREQQQRDLSAQYQTGLQSYYRPYQEAAYMSDILRGVPSTQMSTTSTTAPSPSLLNQMAGLGIAGAGLFG